MTIYQALQVNAAGSKNLIRQAKTKQERIKWIWVYILKIVLTVLFCFSFVTAFSLVFGTLNSIAGVAVLLTLLAVRQADFGIKTSHGTFNLFLVFVVFMAGPKLTNLVSAVPAFFINLICISFIVLLGCHNVIMYNQFTFVLCYLLLQGYDVSGHDFFIRICALLVGAVMCCAIFWIKHRNISYKRNLKDLILEFNPHAQRTKWQIKFVLGICSAMLFASLLHFPRVMWVGISVMSMLVPFYKDTVYRMKRRAPFNIIGGLIFLVLYHLLPESFYPYFGIIGGIGVGLSAGYSAQTIFNVLGALSIAVGTFGLYGAVIIRIAANISATVYVFLYQQIYERVMKRLREKKYQNSVISNQEAL